jgi:hypothetical protein
MLLAGAGSDYTITNPVLNENLKGIVANGNVIEFLGTIIPNLIGLLFLVGIVVFFFMLVFGALQWIFSGGDKGALEAARGRITSALVGIIILFSTFAVIKLIETFFGINILTIDIGPLIIK